MRSVSGVARGFVFVAVLLLAMATAYAPPAHSQPLYNHKGTFEIGGEKPFWERSAMYHMYVPQDLFTLTRRWMRTHWQGT